jgi:hypothetical protein
MNSSFIAFVTTLSIYLGFCGFAAKAKGWDTVLDKVWIAVALLSPSPVKGGKD